MIQNQKICITIKFGDITITPGDLIFIDECSMVVIYKSHEKIVLKRILDVVKNEKNIVNDIFLNKTTEDIINKRGAF